MISVHRHFSCSTMGHLVRRERKRAFLQLFIARSSRGEIATVAEIQLAYEEQTKQPVAPSTIYRLLERHGWRQLGAGIRPVQTSENTLAQGTLVLRREQKEQSSAKGNRKQFPQRYPSDLTDQEWAILEPRIPPAKPGGRPRTVDMREVINAICYVDRTGCQWRALPRDFPPWPTAWTYFRLWRNDGTWERIHTTLREQVRVQQGREPTPSAAIIDSQSVKIGLTWWINNGMVEGHVTKLKLIKRQGYGKAGFPLLRKQVLHAL